MTVLLLRLMDNPAGIVLLVIFYCCAFVVLFVPIMVNKFMTWVTK